MDDFIKTVKPQKVYLDGLDKIISGTNIAFYYWYENKERKPWDAFMPAATLEQAFYNTLCEFPLFAGTLVTDSNGMIYVQVSKDNLNMPVYTDSACEVGFDTIRDAGFNTKLLGRDFDHARDVPVPAKIFGSGKIKLAEIHVIRLQESRGRIIKALVSMSKRTICYFYISQEKISRFCSDVRENATKGQRFSTNDILTAVIASLIVQSMRMVHIEAQAKPIPTIMRYIFGKKTEEQQEALVSVAVSLRPRVPQPDVLNYTGNMIIARLITVPLDLVVADPVPSALAKVSGYIRSAVNDTGAEYICQLGHLANKKSESYMQILLGLLGYKYNLITSNQALFNHYNVDFGMGIPVLVRPALLSFPNSVLIMPGRPDAGKGYEIAMTLTMDVAAKVMQNEHWMGLVDRCDYDV
ncbi:hypothetical protein IWW48_004434 [Coemansia sp. RSA 1200]|nr:hypothetical protein IWW48_004434 [Coemansia sp. RSA 1200]